MKRYLQSKKLFFNAAFLSLLLFIFSSCDLLTNKDDEKDTLYVKFTNDSSSVCTITNIQLMAMGRADATESDPSGEWSENILENGLKLAPGASTYFTLEIPNLHWSQYRLGIEDANGNEIMLHEQANFGGYSESPITHWGGDDRSVYCVISYLESTGTYYVSGWGDWVGIGE